MDIAVTGSSGLIGSALCRSLSARGHRVIRVVRRQAAEGEIAWDPAQGTIDAAGFEGVDVVVHLAGAGVGDKRWTAERKRVVKESRTVGTTLLAKALASLSAKPRLLVSGSAVGYYGGDNGDEVLTESSPPGVDFLAEVCVEWEAAAQPAADAGIRVATIRSGIVLAPDGPAMAKMLPLFKLGLGGRLGSGKQWWPWVTIDDEVGAIEFLMGSDCHVSGPVNVTATNPVTNAEFTKAMGSVLRRPTVLPVPMFGPRLLLGRELADTLVGASQRVVPAVLANAGYTFRHTDVRRALADVLGKEFELA